MKALRGSAQRARALTLALAGATAALPLTAAADVAYLETAQRVFFELEVPLDATQGERATPVARFGVERGRAVNNLVHFARTGYQLSLSGAQRGQWRSGAFIGHEYATPLVSDGTFESDDYTGALQWRTRQTLLDGEAWSSYRELSTGAQVGIGVLTVAALGLVIAGDNDDGGGNGSDIDVDDADPPADGGDSGADDGFLGGANSPQRQALLAGLTTLFTIIGDTVQTDDVGDSGI